jgi:hypothetical protein
MIGTRASLAMVVAGCLFAGCQTEGRPSREQLEYLKRQDGQAAEEKRLTRMFQRKEAEFATPLKKNLATAREIGEAIETESKFSGTKALAPGGSLQVKLHIRKEIRRTPSGFTATSYYELIDTKSGKQLARVGSILPHWKEVFSGSVVQRVWFSRDRRWVMIFESLPDAAAGPHNSVALISIPSGASEVRVSYLSLPAYTHYYVQEDGTVPVGLSENGVLYKPELLTEKFDDNIYKAPFDSGEKSHRGDEPPPRFDIEIG